MSGGTNRRERCLRSVSTRSSESKGVPPGLLALALVLGALAFASPASAASVAIGQLAPGTPAPDCTTPGIDYLEPSVTGGNLYVARQAGTITSWSTNSSGAGATYVVKIFRRTTDPDSFQVIAHSPPHVLTEGINTVPVSLPVKSGDMLGLHESGASNSCTFSQLGDNVLNRAGNLADGSSGVFAPQNDVRLNLAATLVPDNGFSIPTIARNRKRGTATFTVITTNPGVVTAAGKGMKKRPSKSLAVAGPVTFAVAAVGKARHRLARKGRVAIAVRVTFFPTAGDPSIQSLPLTLRRTRPRTPPESP
jgi:hypothetical protein